MALGSPLQDLATADDDTLAHLADIMFRKGLSDGRELSGPIDSYAALKFLPGHPKRNVHRVKLRQVYGAGFDISKANERIKNKL